MNHLSCFVCNTAAKTMPLAKRSNLVMYDNPFPGIEMGFPLSIFESIFKNHYGFNIVTFQSIYYNC